MLKNDNAPYKILDEYSELARNKAIKTRASRVIAINEFYSTQDKIDSSKMSTLCTDFHRLLQNPEQGFDSCHLRI